MKASINRPYFIPVHHRPFVVDSPPYCLYNIVMTNGCRRAAAARNGRRMRCDSMTLASGNPPVILNLILPLTFPFSRIWRISRLHLEEAFLPSSFNSTLHGFLRDSAESQFEIFNFQFSIPRSLLPSSLPGFLRNQNRTKRDISGQKTGGASRNDPRPMRDLNALLYKTEQN